MYVVALSGSPRHEGNTETILALALDTIASHGIDTELIPLAGKTIRPCTACLGCTGTNRCVQDDDFGPIYTKLLAADGIIVGSPVYFGSATPETMAVLDRAGYIARRNGNPLDRKVGGPIVVARRAGQNFTLAQLLLWYMINGLVVPGSTYWNFAVGGDKGTVLEDEEGVRTVRAFADNIAWLLGKLHAGTGE